MAVDIAANVFNFFTLISLSGKYVSATSEAQKASYVAGADLLLTAESVGIPMTALLLSVGLLFLGLAMLRGIFSKWIAYLGLIIGVVGIVGSFPIPALAVFLIISTALAGIFFLAVGFRLYKKA